MLLKPHESEVQGYWLDLGSSVTPDANWVRIDRLTGEYLEYLATADNGTDRLYRDPGDGRLWELTRIAPGLHQGGPPLLAVIGEADAARKYRFERT
jgi:hypothetical protein